MTPRPDARLLAAARLVENLAHRLPAARAHIRREINCIGQLHGSSYDDTHSGERTVTVHVPCDNPDCRTPGEHTHPDSVPVTAVEHSAIRRVDLENTIADLESHAAAIATIAANALNDADRIIGIRTPDIPRCDGRGLEGYDQWGDPTCARPADKVGMCAACYQRCRRWRHIHGLRPLREDVA